MTANGMKDIEENVRSVLPPECDLAKAEFEGPQLVLYLRNMQAFYRDDNLITRIASRVRKKVVVRADSSILMAPEPALAKIKSMIPPEAAVKDIRFDPPFNEVLIEAGKPGVVIGKGGSVLKSIILATGWSPKVLRAPTMPSETMAAVRGSLLAQSESRKKFLTTLGRKIATAPTSSTEWVKITALGGFREIGRSCFLLQTPSSNVLVDCGLNPDTSDPSRNYPYLNAMGISLDEIDAMILSHAHLDHCLHPDSLVQLANGEIRRVEDMEETGNPLVSYDFVAGSTTGAVASRSTSNKPRMLRMQTNLFTIRATPEHRFFTVDGIELKEKRAGELAKGDFVAALRFRRFEGVPHQPLPRVPVAAFADISPNGLKKISEKRQTLGLLHKQVALKAGIPACHYSWLEAGRHKPTEETFGKSIAALGMSSADLAGEYSILRTATLPSESSEEFCQFMGYVLGDGNAHYQKHQAPSNDLAITDKDTANLEFYAKLASDVFKVTPRFSLRAAQGSRNRVFFPSPVTRLFFALDKSLLCRSRERGIPAFIQRASNSELGAFFRGLFDAEGNVGHHSIRLVSSSNRLVRVAQMLLLRFGIQSSIESRRVSNSLVSSHKPFYALVITHPDSLQRFAHAIGFSSQAKAEKLRRMLSTAGHARAEKVDLIPIDGAALKKALSYAGLYETDFDSRISRYWNARHTPSRKTVMGICRGIEAHLARLRLATSREQLRVTQKQVGDALGVSGTLISHIERGKVGSPCITVSQVTGFLQERKQEAISKAEHLLATLRMLVSEELAWVRIRSIEEEIPPEKVYDLSVPGYENFVADGFVVHNCGFIPYLYAYGYEGPLYCTPPTRDLMVLLQQDCINVMNSEGGKAPYGERDIKKELAHVITREYGEVTDVTPDVRFTFHNAGHMLGSAMVHLHIGEGGHNLVYSADIRYGRTRVCDPATTNFPRCETLILESTYGGRNDIKPRQEEYESRLVDLVRKTVANKGRVLIPVIASGRAQEIQLVLEEHLKDPDFPVYIDGMSRESSAIHTVYPEYLRHNVQRRILQNDSPFDKPMFKTVINADQRKSIVESNEPAVILAPSGMLTGGPSLEFLKMMADDPRNALIFVGYQAFSSMGRRLQQGEREIPVLKSNKQETLKIAMGVHSVEGFSGHSDRAQLMAFARNIRPKPARIFTDHGDNGKCEDLARGLNKMLGVETRVPMNLDTIRLK